MINTKRVTLTFGKQCNMRCPFCYAFFDGNDLLTVDKYKKIIRKCKSLNIETVNIAGGDPLLYSEICDIVECSKNLGMRTTLDTNCLSFNPSKHVDLINSLDMISVPIDGCNEKTHDRVRSFIGSFKKVVNTIETISEMSDKIEIRVNTVVVKDNYKELDGIAELLSQYPITFWHIYDFIPIGRGRQHKADLCIDCEEYKKNIYDLMCKGYKYTIEYNAPDKRKQEHIYISSNGTVYSNSCNPYDDYFMGKNILDCSGNSILDYLSVEACEVGEL